jgi:hypothetical protein
VYQLVDSRLQTMADRLDEQKLKQKSKKKPVTKKIKNLASE